MKISIKISYKILTDLGNFKINLKDTYWKILINFAINIIEEIFQNFLKIFN